MLASKERPASGLEVTGLLAPVARSRLCAPALSAASFVALVSLASGAFALTFALARPLTRAFAFSSFA